MRADFVQKYILKNGKLKVLSLTLAVMLWFALSYVGEAKISVSVPVSLQNLARALIVRDTDSDNVLVTIGGPLSVLKSIDARNIKVAIDLSKAAEGRRTYAIHKTSVEVPAGVKVEDVKPDYVVLTIDKIMEKKLRVIVKLDKKWASIYKVGSCYPQYVTVEGPKESLEKIDSIETQELDGPFGHEREEVDAGLDVKNPSIMKVRPETVRVILRR